MADILKNRYYVYAFRPITTEIGRKLQNDMPMTAHRSKSTPGVEFQYGGNPFPKPEVVIFQQRKLTSVCLSNAWIMKKQN